MKQAEFDRFADEYRAIHAANIRISGEGPEYFAEYKIRDTARWCTEQGLTIRSIIDFGAGTGNSIPHFRRYFPDASLTCLDVSVRSLEIAKERFPGQARLTLLESDRIPADDGAFDLAFSACVFHHIDHAEHGSWLGELARVVASRGGLAIFEHNPLNPLTVRAVNVCPFDENARLIRARAMALAVRTQGWSEPDVRYTVFFPAALGALRKWEPRLSWLPLGAQYAVFARRCSV